MHLELESSQGKFCHILCDNLSKAGISCLHEIGESRLEVFHRPEVYEKPLLPLSGVRYPVQNYPRITNIRWKTCWRMWSGSFCRCPILLSPANSKCLKKLFINIKINISIHVHELRDRRDGFESCMSLQSVRFLHIFLNFGSCRNYRIISMAQKVRSDKGVLRVIPPPGQEAP